MEGTGFPPSTSIEKIINDTALLVQIPKAFLTQHGSPKEVKIVIQGITFDFFFSPLDGEWNLPECTAIMSFKPPITIEQAVHMKKVLFPLARGNRSIMVGLKNLLEAHIMEALSSVAGHALAVGVNRGPRGGRGGRRGSRSRVGLNRKDPYLPQSRRAEKEPSLLPRNTVRKHNAHPSHTVPSHPALQDFNVPPPRYPYDSGQPTSSTQHVRQPPAYTFPKRDSSNSLNTAQNNSFPQNSLTATPSFGSPAYKNNNQVENPVTFSNPYNPEYFMNKQGTLPNKSLGNAVHHQWGPNAQNQPLSNATNPVNHQVLLSMHSQPLDSSNIYNPCRPLVGQTQINNQIICPPPFSQSDAFTQNRVTATFSFGSSPYENNNQRVNISTMSNPYKPEYNLHKQGSVATESLANALSRHWDANKHNQQLSNYSTHLVNHQVPSMHSQQFYNNNVHHPCHTLADPTQTPNQMTYPPPYCNIQTPAHSIYCCCHLQKTQPLYPRPVYPLTCSQFLQAQSVPTGSIIHQSNTNQPIHLPSPGISLQTLLQQRNTSLSSSTEPVKPQKPQVLPQYPVPSNSGAFSSPRRPVHNTNVPDSRISQDFTTMTKGKESPLNHPVHPPRSSNADINISPDRNTRRGVIENVLQSTNIISQSATKVKNIEVTCVDNIKEHENPGISLPKGSLPHPIFQRLDKTVSISEANVTESRSRVHIQESSATSGSKLQQATKPPTEASKSVMGKPSGAKPLGESSMILSSLEPEVCNLVNSGGYSSNIKTSLQDTPLPSKPEGMDEEFMEFSDEEEILPQEVLDFLLDQNYNI